MRRLCYELGITLLLLFGIFFSGYGSAPSEPYTRNLPHADLCWECDNIEFLTPKLGKYVGFDGRGIKGQELLKYIEATLADVR